MKRKIPVPSRRTLALIAVFAIGLTALANWPFSLTHNKTHAAGPSMMLLWDGAAAPTGWQFSTIMDGKFPRGDTAANYGTTGGAATEQPTESFSISAASTQVTTGGALTSARSTTAHAHTLTGGSISAASTLPVFRSLKLIIPTGSFTTASIPSTIPAGAIAYFDASPGIPAGTDWTRYSAEDGSMVEINNSSAAGAITTGGSDTHSHTVTWPTLGAATGTVNDATLSGNTANANGHTHTLPSATTGTDTQSNLPQHLVMVMAKANIDTLVPPGMITMFDNDPGGGWSILSGTGGVLNQRFVRGGSAYTGTTLGSASHTHANTTIVTNTAAASTGPGAGTGSSAAAHTHTLTATHTAVNNLPPYFSVVYGKKVGYDLTNYRFYVDSGSQAVTDPWGNPDIAQNTQISQLPAANAAPANQTSLRLRVNFTISGTAMPISTTKFKVQYKQGTDASCTTGSWTDVGAGGGAGVWRYATSSITDGTTLTTSVLSPTSTDLGTYVKSASSTANPVAAALGDTIEYDFHIQDNGAVDNSQYSFRITISDGQTFYSYTTCPTVMTAPGTSDLMRHGNYFYNQVEQGFYWTN